MAAHALFARVAPATYPLDSFDACYQRVLEIWRQIPALVDQDKLEAIGVIQQMYSNWPERCQTELEPGDGYPAKAVFQFWIARYKEKAEWWGLAIPEYEKAVAYLHEKTRPYEFPWEVGLKHETRNLLLGVPPAAGKLLQSAAAAVEHRTFNIEPSTSNVNAATPEWVQPVRRGVQKSKLETGNSKLEANKEGGSDLRAGSVPPSARIANAGAHEESGHGSPSHTNNASTIVSSFEFHVSSTNQPYNASWVVYILRGLARSHAHLDQEKIAERYWDLAWQLTPNCPKLLSEYNCWRAEFLYRRAAPNKVEIYETSQYVLTNGVANPLLREAEKLCRDVFAVYPQPQRRLYHMLGQVLWAQCTPTKQSEAIDLWLEGLKIHGIIPRFVEQEWLLKDLQMSVPTMTTAQRVRYIATLDATIKRIPAIQENVAAIAFVMNQMRLLKEHNNEK
ncbi:MAG: hypothetical protein NTV22_13085 [bacterium]|nr:hypothetical protein [bacterium]